MKKGSGFALALLLALLLPAFVPPARAEGKGGMSLKGAKILLPAEPAVYTGAPVTPDIAVALDGKTLRRDVDYTAEFSNNVNAGKAVVRITGIGEYRGTAKRGFAIYKAENACEIPDLILPASEKAQEAAFSIWLQHEEKLSFSSNRKAVSVNRRGIAKIEKGFAGIAEITVTAPESKNYKRLNKKAYIVCFETPEVTEAWSRSSCSGRLFWNACKGCSGYEIRIGSADSGEALRTETVSDPDAAEARIALEPGARYALSVRCVYTRNDMVFTSPWSEEAVVETPEAVILTGSDYQSDEDISWSAWRIASDLYGRLSDSAEPDAIVLCGDYTDRGENYLGDTKKDLANLKEDLEIFYDDTKPDRRLFLVQGEFDRDEGQFAADGPHETDSAIVYVLNTRTANPWRQGAAGENASNLLRASAANLRAYLAERAAAGERRPVLIATHVPLHFSRRTAEVGGDNLYSGILFDAINEFGDALDIVYLFGHNHGGYGDSGIGGSRICRLPGEPILLPAPAPGEAATVRYRKETLRFVYMNAGYIGYCEKVENLRGSSAGVLTLYPDRIEISRGALKKAVADLSAAGIRPWEGFPEDCLSVRRETVTLPRIGTR